MASGADPARALQEELFCPICLDYFSEPVILNCEHNFCRACILTYWQEPGERFPCPQCRKRSYGGKLRPNRQLGKVAERAKELAASAAASEPPDARVGGLAPASRCSKAEAPQERCRQHGEPLKLFCQQEEALICVICDRSKEHRSHAVVPVEEAAEEYKAGPTQYSLATHQWVPTHSLGNPALRNKAATAVLNDNKLIRWQLKSF